MKIQQIGQFLKDLSSLCLKIDEKWVQRSRKLNTLQLLHILVRLVWSERPGGVQTALVHLMHAAGDAFKVSSSAVSQARKRFDWKLIREIFRFSLSQHDTHDKKYLWKSRRIFAVDGSRITLPHAFQSKKYKSPSKKSHYPQGLLTMLYQLKLEIPHQAFLLRHLDERRAARHHLRYLQEGDILTLDRGFFLQK